jgi:secondary thiamine-phosphate synthase enzyme
MRFQISVNTHTKQEFMEITSLVQECVDKSGIQNGLCFIVVPHCTVAVTVNENKSPELPGEMVQITDELIPQKESYVHFNSASHVQTSLYGLSETLLVVDGKLSLGYFQGIFLVETDGPRSPRRVLVSVIPDEGPVHEIVEEHLYCAAQTVHGPGGMGGPVVIEPTVDRDLVVSLCEGWEVHPAARHLADLSGATAVDGCKSMPPLERVVALIIDGDLGDVARACLKQGIPVINLANVPPSADVPATSQPELYVTAVRPGEDMSRVEEPA